MAEVASVLILQNDKDYLEQYFKLCRIYQEKRLILNKLKESHSKLQALGEISEPLIDDTVQLNKRILELDDEVKKGEGIFWDNVDMMRQNGAKFVIEDISSQYKLEIFEKRVLLFLLFLEYFEIDKNVCTEDELLAIFDIEKSVLSRMRNFKYFMSGSALTKNRLITREARRGCDYAKVECLLTGNALSIISKALNGESFIESEVFKSNSSETIGYVKDPEYKFDDVELTEETKEKVVFFLQSLKNNSLEKLGVSQRIKKGLGSAFLFFGPPGTGKSMLAEAVASYVGKKVLVVEYPKIMDRFVGATDKNIARIFRSAEEEDLVVLLDEADTLFYSRSFALEEHDIRFVNEMLQELERFKGIIILTTNMDVLLDPALERRLSLKVKFELPSKEQRHKIWQSHIPDKIRLAEGVNFKMLATKYDFSGGNIKNAVLNAFRKLASRNSDTLTLEDLIFGANLEKDGMFNVKSKRDIIGFIAQ